MSVRGKWDYNLRLLGSPLWLFERSDFALVVGFWLLALGLWPLRWVLGVSYSGSVFDLHTSLRSEIWI